MEEKVLYVKLPENAQFREVKVTEDGMIGIVYSEESTCQVKKETLKAKFEIPKPKPLVGGSEVYQNDDVPYWYCKIKNGRDEFMHLYIEDLTEVDLLYDSKTKIKRKFSTAEQKSFRGNVLDALSDKPKEGCWIPVFEPSSDEKEGLQFVKGEKPLVGLDCFEWSKKMREYSPTNESRSSSKTTYYLLLLRWLKDGIVTLEQLTERSEKIGHYYNSENAKGGLERTGERKFGGLYGFVGNTFKIVEDSDSYTGYSIIEGSYWQKGNNSPVSEVFQYGSPDYKSDDTVGLLELKK